MFSFIVKIILRGMILRKLTNRARTLTGRIEFGRLKLTIPIMVDCTYVAVDVIEDKMNKLIDEKIEPKFRGVIDIDVDVVQKFKVGGN